MRGVARLAVLAFLTVSSALAGEVPTATRTLIKQHCAECHDAETKKGDLDLTALSFALTDRSVLESWLKVVEQVESGDMPPAKKQERPSATAVTSALTPLRAALKGQLGQAGVSRVRRLNRVEYEQTLRDLLALPALRIKELLPEDGQRHGYDKVAGALDISHIQMSRYLEAAEVALALAASQPLNVVEKKTWRESAAAQGTAQSAIATVQAVPLFNGKLADGYSHKVVGEGANSYRACQFNGTADAVVILKGDLGPHQSQGVQIDRFRPAVAGLYRVRFSAWAMLWDKTEVKSPKEALHVVRASLGDVRLGFFDAPAMKPTVNEFTTWLEPNDRISFHIMSLTDGGNGPHNWPSVEGIFAYSGSAVAFDWFEVEGPLTDAAASSGVSSGVSASRRLLFGDSGKPDVATVTTVMRTFAERAFRRTVAAVEVKPYVDIAEHLMKQGRSLESALLSAYQAILCAPDFLFLGLEDGLAEAAKAKLGPFALAARLSFMLTNGPPDDELLKLAANGSLSRPKILRAQAERLLASSGSQRFVTHFLDQWLDLRKIDFTTPDKGLYPSYDTWLHDASLAESRGFFRTLLTDDLSVSNLVASSFVVIDQRLARHYGIDGVQGAALRRVPLPAGSARGGFLTQAAVLKITANGTVTSPILRGVWVSERLLGIPHRPPPPNIPAAEPDASGATTIRQIIERHRADSACAGCHAKIDPPGMALETFDAIGAQRTHYLMPDRKQGLAIDSSGKLKGGGAFSGIGELRALLVKDNLGLARSLARQFLIYGTGSNVGFLDLEALDAIVVAAKPTTYGVRSLLMAVVVSDLFQSK